MTTNSYLPTIALLGPSSDLDRCEDVAWKIRKFAILAFDWPRQMRDDEDAGIHEIDFTEAERIAVRDACFKGIDSADVCLWLSDGKSIGSAVEAGYAARKGVPIFIAGVQHPVYASLGMTFRTDDAALMALNDWAVRRMAGNRP
jgi:nucleoside 2-deoxyribosyltransferase